MKKKVIALLMAALFAGGIFYSGADSVFAGTEEEAAEEQLREEAEDAAVNETENMLSPEELQEQEELEHQEEDLEQQEELENESDDQNNPDERYQGDRG